MHSYLYNLAFDKYKGKAAAVVKFFLFAFSVIYGFVIGTLIFIQGFKKNRLNCKVISVGNITLGGTGKTALVELIARYLKQRGLKVVILTRGYKRKSTRGKASVISSEAMGDEPYMLSKHLGDTPILVDKNRIRAAKRALREYKIDTVILDDGFQQWRIKKDLEILTIDTTNPFGNGRLIPRGILREPLYSLKRADVFVLTKTNLNQDLNDIKDTLNKYNPSGMIVESFHKPVGFYRFDRPLEFFNENYLRAKTVTLFSGIGDPDSFESLIAILGIHIGLSFKFADHYNYTQQDLDAIIKSSLGKGIDTIVTTEKDAARLACLKLDAAGFRLLVLRIQIAFKDEQEFYNRLHKLCPL